MIYRHNLIKHINEIVKWFNLIRLFCNVIWVYSRIYIHFIKFSINFLISNMQGTHVTFSRQAFCCLLFGSCLPRINFAIKFYRICLVRCSLCGLLSTCLSSRFVNVFVLWTMLILVVPYLFVFTHAELLWFMC